MAGPWKVAKVPNGQLFALAMVVESHPGAAAKTLAGEVEAPVTMFAWRLWVVAMTQASQPLALGKILACQP